MTNDLHGLATLVERLRTLRPALIVLEATGGLAMSNRTDFNLQGVGGSLGRRGEKSMNLTRCRTPS